MAFAELGATYVKFGQLVASAPSVFGQEVADEFRSLLDSGRAVSIDKVRHEVEHAVGAPLESVFSSFDRDPIGRASMAVVHRATLITGEDVAVKVLRPGIERKIAADLALMGWLLPRIAGRVEGAQTDMIGPMLDGLRGQLCEELDLRNEARVMDHFNDLLARIDLPDITIPRTYPELSDRRVLVMAYLDGVPIDDLSAIEDFGLDPTPLVTEIVKSFFLTAVRYGVFHGDVHAGNLLLLRDGHIGVLDWGIVGRLNDDSRAQLRSIIGAALGDERAWAEVIDHATEQIGPMIKHRFGLTDEQLPPMIRSVLEPLFTLPFGQVKLSTLLLGPDELTGGDPTAAGSPADAPRIDPAGFDRNMMLLTKQLLYFERYGAMYLSEISLFEDRTFFEALLADGQDTPDAS